MLSTREEVGFGGPVLAVYEVGDFSFAIRFSLAGAAQHRQVALPRSASPRGVFKGEMEDQTADRPTYCSPHVVASVASRPALLADRRAEIPDAAILKLADMCREHASSRHKLTTAIHMPGSFLSGWPAAHQLDRPTKSI